MVLLRSQGTDLPCVMETGHRKTQGDDAGDGLYFSDLQPNRDRIMSIHIPKLVFPQYTGANLQINSSVLML